MQFTYTLKFTKIDKLIFNKGEHMSNLGGLSGPLGITFFGENYRASLYTPISIGWKGIKLKPREVSIKKSVVKNEMKLFLGILLIIDIIFNSRTFILEQLTNLWSVTIAYVPFSLPEEYTKPVLDFPWILLVLFLQICVISFMAYSMKLTRSFHGSEHKVIAAAENNDLTNALKYSRIHPRCGTNILPMYFVYISILSYLFFPMMLGGTAIVLSLYTIQKVPPIGKLSVTIGSKLQLLTTKEPLEKQLNDAIKSMEYLLDAEKNGLPNNAKELTVKLN